MSGNLKFDMTPQCLGHLRLLAGMRTKGSPTPICQQIRGKKKSTKGPHTVNVRLLEDIEGYGRKGTIIPIAPGRMRNMYYPQRKAEYVTQAQIRTMNQKDLVIERDFAFGLRKPKEESEQEEVKAPEVRLALVTSHTDFAQPRRAVEIMETLVPAVVVFYRAPIAATELDPEPEPERPLGNSINAIGGESSPKPASKPRPKPITTKIFGSVSTTDMVDSIKAVLAEDEEGARVVLGAEDIVISETTDEARGVEEDRLKAMGDYKIEIRLKGVDPIQRVVSIKPQETDK
ncbi:MAG: hypothetical protein Q9174_005836 [Haloplaca sp. 1 TL-2023]